MDFSKTIGELKCATAKWCSYAAIFHHLMQCLKNLVSKTKTEGGMKKNPTKQKHTETPAPKPFNKIIFILVRCINFYCL